MNRIQISAVALGLALSRAAVTAETVTAGRLMVHPHRVILDDSPPRAKGERGQPPKVPGRSAEIALINGGKERSAYRISFMTMDMDTEGRLFEKARVPGEVAAADLIRFSPRKVVLEAGSTQTIRIQVRMREGLPPGEYRSHMMFRAVPLEDEPQASANPPAQEPAEPSLSVNLKAIYGLSIPIIIRHGATQATISISSLRWELAPNEGHPALRFRLERSGNRSVFGHMDATWTPRGGLPKVVGNLKGIAIYTNISYRDVNFELDGLPAKELGPGTLKIKYQDPETRKVLAEASLELPPKPPS